MIAEAERLYGLPLAEFVEHTFSGLGLRKAPDRGKRQPTDQKKAGAKPVKLEVARLREE